MCAHVIWDWNGTLFDDVGVVAAATSEVLAGVGLPPITTEEHRRQFTRPVWVFYERILGRPLADGEFEKFDRMFHDAYGRMRDTCTLSPGATAALRAWKERGHTQSLLSMWRHDDLVPLVSELGIDGYFTRVDGLRGEAGGFKAAHLLRHLQAVQVAGSDALLIGDTVDDADAAAHVGARCILYSRGYAAREALEQASAPVVDTLGEALAHA